MKTALYTKDRPELGPSLRNAERSEYGLLNLTMIRAAFSCPYSLKTAQISEPMRPPRQTISTKRKAMTIAALALASLASPLTASHQPVARTVVEIVISPAQEPPAVHGIRTLRAALEARGFRVTERSADEPDAKFVILAGTSADCEAARVLKESGIAVPSTPEALVIRRAPYHGRSGLVLSGSDARGLMYAALDVAERVPNSTGAILSRTCATPKKNRFCRNVACRCTRCIVRTLKAACSTSSTGRNTSICLHPAASTISS
jgi:hypothetical protein